MFLIQTSSWSVNQSNYIAIAAASSYAYLWYGKLREYRVEEVENGNRHKDESSNLCTPHCQLRGKLPLQSPMSWYCLAWLLGGKGIIPQAIFCILWCLGQSLNSNHTVQGVLI